MVKPCSRNKNSPLVRLQNKYERYGTENNVLSGRGLARRPLSARRVHIKMTSHVAQCIHNTSYCAARELCRLQIWTKRYREHFTVLVIWTLVYREHVPRTFCQGFVPRTYMNGLLDLCAILPYMYFGKRKQVTYHPNLSYWCFHISPNVLFFQVKLYA